MAKKRVGHIIISRRVVQIGHKAYPLANISRVQILPVQWAGRLATSQPLRPIASLVALLAAAVLIPPRLPSGTEPDVVDTVRQAAEAVIPVAAIGVAALSAVLLHRAFFRRKRYALVIETAGTQYSALMGTDFDEIQRIKTIIVDAIEDPPVEALHVDVRGDLVMGDKADTQYKQTGSGNHMFT